MSNALQLERDAERILELQTQLREESRNLDIAREAIQIAAKYQRKADDQRVMLKQLQEDRKNEPKEQREARSIAHALNSFGFNDAAFCEQMASEHKTLQQSFTRLCISWIRHCAEFQDWQVDGRNEAGVQVCKELNKLLKEKGYGSLPMI